MEDVLRPLSTDNDGLIESVKDPTSAEGMVFYHADEGKPLATPWQVAITRAILLNEHKLPEGYLLDCACGSGIQIAAYSTIIKRPVIGIELNPQRAKASAVNLTTVFTERGDSSVKNLRSSLFIIGDGRDGKAAIDKIKKSNNLDDVKIGLLHLDPARPRNSRSHSLDEMKPRLDEVFLGWKEYLSESENGPAILLDLSPRLSYQQRLEVEQIVEDTWPLINKTWTWISRGKGRVDRLALWLGSIAKKDTPRRFIRVSPDLKNQPFIFEGGIQLSEGEDVPISSTRMPKRGEYITVLDSALVECGLAQYWLESLKPNPLCHWVESTGRRPQIHHEAKLPSIPKGSEFLIQASGRIVEIFHQDLNLETVDQFVEKILTHDIKRVTIRSSLNPEHQPKIQGSFDRQLSRRHGKRDAFLIQHPSTSMSMLCVIE
jgi:hypothetical protein